jgi:predicted RNase H-like HicB family nuclease
MNKVEENYSIEIEEEVDGRWIADIIDFPGLVMAYGSTKQEAMANVTALAFKMIAERIQETKIGTTKIAFGIVERRNWAQTPKRNCVWIEVPQWFLLWLGAGAFRSCPQRSQFLRASLS